MQGCNRDQRLDKFTAVYDNKREALTNEANLQSSRKQGNPLIRWLTPTKWLVSNFYHCWIRQQNPAQYYMCWKGIVHGTFSCSLFISWDSLTAPSHAWIALKGKLGKQFCFSLRLLQMLLSNLSTVIPGTTLDGGTNSYFHL